MSSVSVRVATLEDVPFILALEKDAMPHPWVEEDIRSLITDENKLALVASFSDFANPTTDCGYVGVSWVLDEAEIGNICVLSSMRRKGVAEAILTSLKSFLKDKGVVVVFLEVDENNTGAIKLYEKNGFEMYSRRKGYYHNDGKTNDALLYKLEML